MIDELAATGGKYSKAMAGERLAFFSLIGTSDWQDYAQLVFDAMNLEATLDVDARLEEANRTLARMEKHLERISQLLESNIAPRTSASANPEER